MSEERTVQAAELWRKFLVVTQEMRKFLARSDIDMFLSLLEQRQRLQASLEKLRDDTYHRTAEGKALIAQINPINTEIQYQAQLWLNKTKRQQSTARAYDSLGDVGQGRVGNILNKFL